MMPLDQWQCRLVKLSACVDAEDGHLEHFLGLQTSHENFILEF